MSKYYGYMGKILDLDLSNKTISEYPWTDKDRAKYPGGKSTASKIMYDYFTGKENPLGEENIIVVSTGPVTGLGAPFSNRFDISTLSPQTGISSSSNCGGDFGYFLKRAGYDALIIRGKLEKPGWILIENENITFKDADELWGLKVGETQDYIHRQIDKELRRSVNCGIITIGPAGENLVKYASVISGERAAGRTGTGAVFGSKNLKAVVSTGNHMAVAAKPERLIKYNIRWTHELQKHPTSGNALPKLGSASLATPMQLNKQLGTKNFTAGQYDQYEKVCGEALAKENVAPSGCVSCPIHCARKVKVGEKIVKGPELETLALLGANIVNDDIKLINKWNYELDELGMDTISAGQTVAWAMMAKERGVHDFGLEFGKTDNISNIWDDIAHRRGVGNELAEGSKRLSEKYGGTEFAMQSKGLELSAYEPRQSVGQGLGYAVSNRGGCHLNGGYLISLEGLSLHINPHTTKGKADLCMMLQDLMESLSSNGQCLFSAFAVFPAFLVANPNSIISKLVDKVLPYLGGVVRLINKLPEIAFFNLGMIPHSKELKLATGMRMTLGKFLRNGERSYNIERALNAKFGVSAEKDTLPKQLTDIPQDPNDPTTIVPLEKMKKTYYKARGWGEDGLPSKKKLRRLGIV